MSAVSMKLTPASKAAVRTSMEAASSAVQPSCIVPRQSSETLTPVAPRSRYSAPRQAPAFPLAAPAGKAFDSGEAHGSAVLLFFGYTFCPDACPATTADVA